MPDDDDEHSSGSKDAAFKMLKSQDALEPVEPIVTKDAPPTSQDAAPSQSQPLDIPSLARVPGEDDPEATPVARRDLFKRDDDREVAKAPQASTSTSTSNAAAAKQLSMSALRGKVCRAAATGDLDSLKALLHPADDADTEDYPSSFALVNSPTSSGLTPLLEAASHGHLRVVRHLLEEEGAVRDLEDVEGENAFLKASYRGHLEIMKYLHSAEDGTDVNCADREGWTALHNAAGKGYLEIAMWLAEHGASIDAVSRQGYTPLMNAASKGHLPIVNYLVSRHVPDPLLRNSYGETAFDVAVATFELGIADILAQQEAIAWRSKHPVVEYNPLGLHLAVPVILYENQRLDLRWQAKAKQSILATAAGSARAASSVSAAAGPKFTSQALSRRDGHANFELPPSWDGLNSTGQAIPIRRTEVHPPSLSAPNTLPLPARALRRPSSPIPGMQRSFSASSQVRTPTAASAAMSPTASTSSSTASLRGLLSPSTPVSASPSFSDQQAEPAWYFLSSAFFVDLSPATVDPEEGWQYAPSFSTPPEQWTAEMPEQVLRILAGDQPPKGAKWVRRRRWARVLRRRLDVPDWGFLDAPEPAPSSASPQQSYLDRAKYFAGSHDRKHSSRKGKRREAEPATSLDSALSEKHALSEDDASSVRSVLTVIDGLAASSSELDRQEARRVIARVERAIAELDEGMQDDDNEGRKTEAWELKKVYEERLLTLREDWPAFADGEADDDDASFRYPGADSSSDDDSASVSTSLRSASMYSPRSSPPQAALPPFRRTSSLGLGSPAARQLAFPAGPAPGRSISQLVSANPDFRVPVDETPRQPAGLAQLPRISGSVATSGWASGRLQRSSVPWEADESTNECRRCQRKFTFFLRKHHCRKCGLVVCAHCSPHQDWLRSSEVVQEPTPTGLSEPFAMLSMLEGGGYYRTCDVCHTTVAAAQAAGEDASPAFLDATIPTLQIGSHTIEARASPDMQRSLSDSTSELGECPVCGTNLAALGDASTQEKHIQTCLDSGAIPSREPDNRVGVFTLPDDSPLVGDDCLICFESYAAGDQIGRLGCLCHFHRHCITNWLSRGKSCPVHAR